MQTSCGGAGARGLLGILAGSLVAIVALLLGPAPSAEAATITVTTGTDELSPNNGHVSLREAITAINAGSDGVDSDITAQHPGSYGSSDTIKFGIFGSLLAPCLKTIHVGEPGSASGMPLPQIRKS